MASDDLNLKVKFTIDTGSFKEVDDAIRKINERAGKISVSGGGTRSQPSQAAREPSRNKQAEIEAYKKGYEEQKKTLEGIIRAQDPAKKIDPVFRGLKNQLADINNGIRRGRAMGEDVSEAKGKQQAVKEEIERGKQILATKEQVRETGFLNVLTKKWRQSITGVLIDLHVLRIVGQSSKVVSAMFEVLSKSIGYVVDMALLPALPFLLDFASLIRELGHWIAELNPTTKKMIGVAVLLVGGFFVMLNTVRSVINSLIWFKLALDSASKSSLGRTVSDKVAGGGAIAGAAKFGAAGVAGVLATIGLGTLYMKMAKAAGWDKVDPTFSKSVAQSPFGMFAAGGLLKSGQAAVVGEKGPELLIPGSGGYNVVPNNGLRFLAEGTTPSILDSFLGLITGGITGFIGKFSDIASTVVSGIFGKSILGGGVDTGVGLTTGDSERQLLAKGFSGTITASTSEFKNANTLLAAILAALLNPIGKLADLLTPDSPVPIRASALWELVWDKVLIPLKNVWDLTWSVVDVLADELWHLVIDPLEYTADQLWKLAEPIVDIIPFPWKLGHPATTEVPFPWKLATLSAAAATISFPWVLLGPLVKEVAFPWVLQAPADTTIDWPYTVEKPTTTLKITTWYEVFTTPTAVLLRWADVFTKPAPVTTLTWYDVITLPVAMVLGWKDILILPVAMAISSWEEVFDTPDVPIVYDNWSSIISLPPPLNKEWYEIFKFGTSFPYVLYWSQVFKLPDVPQVITASALYVIQPVVRLASELFSITSVVKNGIDFFTPSPTPTSGSQLVTPQPTPTPGSQIVTPTPTPSEGKNFFSLLKTTLVWSDIFSVLTQTVGWDMFFKLIPVGKTGDDFYKLTTKEVLASALFSIIGSSLAASSIFSVAASSLAGGAAFSIIPTTKNGLDFFNINGTGSELHNEIVSKFPGIASQFETTMKTAVGSITATNATTGQQYQVQTLTVPASQTSSYVNPTSGSTTTTSPVTTTPSASNPVVTMGPIQGTNLNYTSAQWSSMDANARQQLVNSGQVYTVGGVQYKNGSVYDPSKYGNTGSGGGSSTPVVISTPPEITAPAPGFNWLAYDGGKKYGMTRTPDGDDASLVEITTEQFKNQILERANTPVYSNKSGTGNNLNAWPKSVIFPYSTSVLSNQATRKLFTLQTERIGGIISRDKVAAYPSGSNWTLNLQQEPYMNEWVDYKLWKTIANSDIYKMMEGSASERIPGLALGGSLIKSGLAWVGERGRELMALPRGAEVMPHTPSMDLLAKQTKPQVIDKSVHYHIDGNTFQVSGKDERQLFENFMRLMERESRRVRG